MQDKPQARPQLKKNGFTFKQFFVAHDRCAMKVGTDGILLGAWAPVAGVKRILDIGTGSGLIALMLAQRTPSNVDVDAVELDPDAAQQAHENIQQSPWAARMQVHQQDIARGLKTAKRVTRLSSVILLTLIPVWPAQPG